MNDFRTTFKNKRILVTGGTGSIGSEIVRQLIPLKPKQIRIYSRDESKQYQLQHELSYFTNNKDILRFLIGDIRDKERLKRAFNDIDIVFHAAALKHVPFCEDNPFEATKTNVQGTQNVLDLAIDHRVEKVIAISSDKAVNPNTFMGITKLMMERMVISAANYSGQLETKFAAVRFGNVINSRGSVIPLWIDQIKKGGPVTVTDKKMERYFMTIRDAVNLIFMSTKIMLGKEIFVLKMSKCNIYELAQEVIDRYSSGKLIKIKITGSRIREKLDERLYTDEEEQLMIDAGLFNIIQPTMEDLKKRLSKYNISKKNRNIKIADIFDSLPKLNN
ncbi:MAG: SDR family NAD(P)-dependent oxidoreductase [Microgenomates group bacterium]|jgi:FlaA1/EpsC-like NDP-sugar epimerase